MLTAFADLHATYTTTGLVLDRLTPTQRLILAHLDIPLPWPETPTTTNTIQQPQTLPPTVRKTGLAER